MTELRYRLVAIPTPRLVAQHSICMNEQELFAKFWTVEARTTCRVFARIPDGSNYRPDPRSRTAKQIAWQICTEEKYLIDALETGHTEWRPASEPHTMMDVLAVYETQSADIIQRLCTLPAEKWNGSLTMGGKQRPAAPMAWSFLFDIVHHRGQITTYLRPMGSTVPQIYGPSGDEP